MQASSNITRSNFAAHLSAYTLHISNVADGKTWGRDFKASMLRVACTLSDAAKTAADLQSVQHLETKYRVKAQPMEQRSRYSGWTFEKDTAADQALKRARALLAPANEDEAEAAIEKLVSFKAGATDPVASLLAKFEKLSGPQKRSFLAKLNAR